MRILFLHQNFPGQFPHIAKHLATINGNQVISLSQSQANGIPEVANVSYRPARSVTKGIHHYIAGTESAVLNGQATIRLMEALKKKGFVPDFVIGHAGWGETLYVKDVFPSTKLINYFEFFYHATGADTDFDPEFPNTADDVLRIRTKNIVNLLALTGCDAGISPTQWQKSLYPSEFHPKISVIHEGVNLELLKFNPDASFRLPNGRVLTKKDKVITFVARNLEPYRGFHVFMRATEEICKLDPDVQVVIIGADDVSYGRRLTNGETYRQKMLNEVSIDQNRVHFVGRLPYQTFIDVFHISSAHVYLTVPFVLSWSMLEAMAASCLVIGSATAPVQEVIEHGKNGLLVDYFSPKEIAETAVNAVNNPAQYQAIRDAARDYIGQHYSVQKSINQYMDLLQKVWQLSMYE